MSPGAEPGSVVIALSSGAALLGSLSTSQINHSEKENGNAQTD
jgi:hypothetical protein